MSAGAVHGELEASGGLVLHGVGDGIGVARFRCDERFFDLAAATQTPHGAADFVDEIVFEYSGGSEIFSKTLVEAGIEGFFAGPDEVLGGEETIGDRIFGGGGFTCFGAGSSAGRGLRVFRIGRELR